MSFLLGMLGGPGEAYQRDTERARQEEKQRRQGLISYFSKQTERPGPPETHDALYKKIMGIHMTPLDKKLPKELETMDDIMQGELKATPARPAGPQAPEQPPTPQRTTGLRPYTGEVPSTTTYPGMVQGQQPIPSYPAAPQVPTPPRPSAFYSPDEQFEQQLDQVVRTQRALLPGKITEAIATRPPSLMSAPPTSDIIDRTTGAVIRKGEPKPSTDSVGEQDRQAAIAAYAQKHKLDPTTLTPLQRQEAWQEWSQGLQRPFAPILIHTTDPTGKEVQQIVPRTPGATYAAAPTVEMRNREMARANIRPAMEHMQNLSSKLISKTGPAQRLEAVVRGWNAVLGNDPEFQTYQDVRNSFAATLAVAEQGSRPSDTDVMTVYLRLIPNAFSDTEDSARMKWEIVELRAGLKKGKIPGGITVQTPDGQHWNFSTHEEFSAAKQKYPDLRVIK